MTPHLVGGREGFCFAQSRRKEPGSVGGADFLSHLGSDQRPGGKLTENSAGNHPCRHQQPRRSERKQELLLGDVVTSTGEFLGKKKKRSFILFKFSRRNNHCKYVTKRFGGIPGRMEACFSASRSHQLLLGGSPWLSPGVSRQAPRAHLGWSVGGKLRRAPSPHHSSGHPGLQALPADSPGVGRNPGQELPR